MIQKLGVDIDETVVPCLPNFLKYYNQKYNTNFSIGEFKVYKWWEILNIPKTKIYKIAQEYFKEIGEYNQIYGDSLLEIEFIPGSEQSLDILSRYFQCYFISHRKNELLPESFNISSKLYIDNDTTFFPKIPILEELIIPYDRVYHTDLPKSQICKKLGINTIIEDDSQVAIDCTKNGIEVVLLERPWNKNLKNCKIIKTKNWQEVCDVLLEKKILLPDFKPKDYEEIYKN